MTKIDYVSDLHIDFWARWNNNQQKYEKAIKTEVKKTLPEKPSEILIIAGDIANSVIVSKWVIEEYLETYKKILLVLGNHDYYLDSKNQQSKFKWSSENKVNVLRDFVNEKENVKILEGMELLEIDELTIAGDINWYDGDDLEIRKKTPNSNDWETIRRVDYKKYREKVKKNIEKIKEPIDLIITHIPPVIYPSYELKKEVEEEKNYLLIYTNSLEIKKARNWISGHMHEKTEFEKEGVKFFINCIGYPRNRKEEIGKIKTLEIKKEG